MFGEADRKILQSYNDSYLISNLSGNLVKLLNDVTGTATVLALLAVSGILGVTFVFSASSIALAKGGSSVFDEFYDAFSVARGEKAANQANKDEARANAKLAGLLTGRILDPIPGDPIASFIDRLIPDLGIYGNPGQ